MRLPVRLSFVAALVLGGACDEAGTTGAVGGDTAGAADVQTADASAGTDAADDSADTATTTGTVILRFSVSKGVRKSPNLEDPLVGTIYGSLWHKADIALTGPRDGAEDLQSVEVTGVDLTEAEVSAASWQSAPLDPGDYMFLGFFDVDGNGAEEHDPDSGDPVTLPINGFTIEAGKTLEFTVPFELVYN